VCLPVSRYAKASSNALGLVLRCRDTFSSELVAEGTEAENEITEVRDHETESMDSGRMDGVAAGVGDGELLGG